MSTGRRAYDLLRGYINREFERIHDLDRTSAEDELAEAMEGPQGTRSVPHHEAEFEVITLSDEQKARQVLGVGAEASYGDIKKAFERLNVRSDPVNFPAGSAEARQAEQIRSRVHRAYRILSDKFDTTERRFRGLEID
jgi:DnaJ-class molecular chaperone